MTKLAAILDQIDSGSVLLPEFQRGYVWNRDQVRGLMRSLYLGYPVGGLLTWETLADGSAIRGGITSNQGHRVLILDGQQRVTSLYGISRGRPPGFFQGDEKAFTGLHFNVEQEIFEFYAPARMRDDRRWIDVTALFVHGLEPHIASLNGDPDTQVRIVTYMERLIRLHSVLDREFHEEKITGEDKTVDVVVDIFNRVNSGGTKLSKGDLALAKMCAHWPEARAAMRSHLETWQKDGFAFSLDWLLRNTTAVATGRAEFASLEDVEVNDFKHALDSSAKYVSKFLDVVAGRLGLDHDRVLMGRYAFPVVSRLLHLAAGHFADAAESDRALFWYIHSALWGRFAGSTETVLNQDYDTATRSGVGGLIATLERWRGGNLTIDGQDFEGFGRGSRFYPLLYMLTRVHGARDFGSGLPLHSHLLGYLASLQVHHIFPKAVLYDAGYHRSQVNAVANFCFLTQENQPGYWQAEARRLLRRRRVEEPRRTRLTVDSPGPGVVADRAAGPATESGMEEDPLTSAGPPAADLDTGPSPEIRTAFERAMKDVYVRAKKEANYTATYLLSMLSDYGGLGTAHRLLGSSEVSTGFAALYERGRLDLTVEALVVKPEFAGLFTEAEVDIARQRLDQLGYR